MADDSDYRQLINLAWQEFLVASGTRGVSPEALISFSGVPDWFVRNELGFSVEHRPSLAATYERWRKIESRLLREIAAEPVRKKKPSAVRPTMEGFRAVVDRVWQGVRHPSATPVHQNSTTRRLRDEALLDPRQRPQHERSLQQLPP